MKKEPTQIVKHAGGRPTLYTPQVIEDINKYLTEAIPQNMKIPTVEGIALKLGISRDTLYEWAKVHPEFSDTLEELKMRQKEALTEIGIFGGKEINATIVKLLMEVNHGMNTPQVLQQFNVGQGSDKNTIVFVNFKNETES